MTNILKEIYYLVIELLSNILELYRSLSYKMWKCLTCIEMGCFSSFSESVACCNLECKIPLFSLGTVHTV